MPEHAPPELRISLGGRLLRCRRLDFVRVFALGAFGRANKQQRTANCLGHPLRRLWIASRLLVHVAPNRSTHSRCLLRNKPPRPLDSRGVDLIRKEVVSAARRGPVCRPPVRCPRTLAPEAWSVPSSGRRGPINKREAPAGHSIPRGPQSNPNPRHVGPSSLVDSQPVVVALRLIDVLRIGDRVTSPSRRRQFGLF